LEGQGFRGFGAFYFREDQVNVGAVCGNGSGVEWDWVRELEEGRFLA
jgi:hypothetical protein